MTRSRLIRRVLLVIVVCAVTTAGGLLGGCRRTDPPAVVVGDSVLRVSEVAPIVDRALQSELLSMPAGLDAAGRRARLEAQVGVVMNALVDEQLILAEATRLGLTVSEADVETGIEDLRARFPDVYEAVVAKIGREGYAAKLRMHRLYEGAKASIIAAEGKSCPAERPPDSELLARWLKQARAGTAIRVLYKPALGPYLKGGGAGAARQP